VNWEQALREKRANQLIRKAVRQRASRRSGRSRVTAILVIAVIATLGLALIFVLPNHVAGIILGIIALVCAALGLITLPELNPANPWGEASPASCPRCGQHSLRQKRMELYRQTHSLGSGRGAAIYTRTTTVTWSGIVTLCTTDCGYTSVRKPEL
jgi:hypothetical protein